LQKRTLAREIKHSHSLEEAKKALANIFLHVVA
jgi:hypothetical protein